MNLEKREATVLESKKTINKLVKSAQESRQLLENTLNVKLRYEEIIKALMDNEKQKVTKSVQEIIKSTQASKQVQINKTKPVVKSSTVTIVDANDISP